MLRKNILQYIAHNIALLLLTIAIYCIVAFDYCDILYVEISLDL